jgi:phosphatidylinositol alpha-1,6-mannosyltransferase
LRRLQVSAQRPRKIPCLLAAESLAPKASGIGRVARLMEGFLGEGGGDPSFELRSVTLNDPSGGPREPGRRLPVLGCEGERLRFVLRVQRRALSSAFVFYDSLSMARAHPMGPAFRRPHLAWMHGIEVWEEARDVHLAAARRAPVLVTNSRYTRERAARLHPELARARVCWLGTETDRPPPDRPPNEGPPTVLILARIDVCSYKGHTELLELWPELLRRVPDARLLIAGDGPGRPLLEEKASSLVRSGAVEFTGFVREEDIPTLWARADVFAMPSRGEGFGLVYIEAMRHGIPVIASRQDAGQEVNVDGETGFNVDLGREGELLEALAALLRDPVRRRAMGERGRERWRKHFTQSAFFDRFRNVLIEEHLFPGA